MMATKAVTQCDVLVVGGGLSGFAAGLTCAREGLRVLVAASHPVLGWEGVWTFQNALPSEPHGLAREVADAVDAVGARGNGLLDSAVLELTLDGMAAEANMDVLYHVRPVALLACDGVARGAVLAGKSGEVRIDANVLVDATHAAALWQCSAAELEAPPQRLRYGLILNHVSALTEPVEPDPPEGCSALRVAPSVWPGEARVLFDAETSATVEAQLMVPAVLETVREAVPACSEALVTQMAFESVPLKPPAVGALEGRTHSAMDKLLAAGPWAGKTDLANDAFAGLLELGEEVGRQAAAAAQKSSPEGEPERLDAPNHERSSSVALCGGGTAGVLAALAAAREGAETLLIEATPILGGIGTGGNIHGYYYGVAGGLQDALDARTDELTPLMAPHRRFRGFHPVAKWIASLQMLREAGVRLMLNTTVFDVPTRDTSSEEGRYRSARIQAVRAVGPGGMVTCRAEQFIDSTGDADIAAAAGAPFHYGREGDGVLHPYTLSGTVIGPESGVRYLNFDAGYCDSDDVWDLTRARRDGLQHYRRDQYAADDRLLFIAPLIGIRQGRQIVGEYTLTLGDETLARQFDDVIAYAMSNFDNHARDYASESDEAVVFIWLLGKRPGNYGCEVPYRCLVPLRVDNLLVACRGVSLTQDAHYQMRMMRDMQRIGEAAGVAAALCAILGFDPRDLPVKEVQQRLFATGSLGAPDADRSHNAQVRLHWSDAFPEAPKSRPVEEWAEQLGGDDPTTAVWMLMQEGEGALPVLLDAVHHEDEDVRFWASVPLAMVRSKEAVPALLQTLKERRSEGSDSPHSAPAWMTAAVLLGRVGDRRAVPALAEVLQEEDVSKDACVAVLRALGRIGDPSAAPAVRQFLKRDDIDTRQDMAGGPWLGPVRPDVRWRLELAAAEALARMGEDVDELLAPYLEDERRYVRRRAESIAQIA